LADAQTFTWLNKQSVRSSEGFELQRIERFEWEYREGQTTYLLSGEPTFGGGHGFAFFDWQPTPSPDRRARIQRNIEYAMNFMDLKADFD
jgi:hypothetical protein